MLKDELDEWVDHMLEISPEYRRAYYQLARSRPLPLRWGVEYRRRRRRR